MKTTHRIEGIAAIALGLAFTTAVGASTTTDTRIEHAAKQTYVFRTYLTNDSIEVRSQDGVVTLTGTVTDSSNKRLADDTVAALPGVKRVNDQLEVRNPAPLAQAPLRSRSPRAPPSRSSRSTAPASS